MTISSLVELVKLDDILCGGAGSGRRPGMASVKADEASQVANKKPTVTNHYAAARLHKDAAIEHGVAAKYASTSQDRKDHEQARDVHNAKFNSHMANALVGDQQLV